MAVYILLYANNDIMLKVNLPKTKIMIFDRSKRKLNQEAIYLDKDRIEINHEYKYLGIDFYSHGFFKPSSNGTYVPTWRRFTKESSI